MQGSCSDPRPAEMLGLHDTDASIQGLQPLKPFQCLILVAGPWLAVDNGRVWVDNIYLKLWRPHDSPTAAFIANGLGHKGEHDIDMKIFITNATFHSEGAHAIGRATKSPIGVHAIGSHVYMDGVPSDQVS